MIVLDCVCNNYIYTSKKSLRSLPTSPAFDRTYKFPTLELVISFKNLNISNFNRFEHYKKTS